MDVAAYMMRIGLAARAAARVIAQAPTAQKNAALMAIAQSLTERRSELKAANAMDLAAAATAGLDAALVDRLQLTDSRIDDMVRGLAEIAALADPVGAVTDLNARPSGIQVGRMRVPLGVIGIIYESRPNVTVDAAGLCLKAGNATILRGGSEALRSNLAIAESIAIGLSAADLPTEVVQVVGTADRDLVGELIRATGYVDVIVPRGGKELIARICAEATVPVIKHLDGVCHLYIDSGANLDMAVALAVNSKTQRYGVCNAMETLLVDETMAQVFLPAVARPLLAAGVEIRGCTRTRQLIPQATAATDDDWRTEYLAPILAVRVVTGLDAAMAHIADYGSGHTDGIVTDCLAHARRFLREVDSSSVLVNTSTRFADGFEYGLGAEIGISTDKLHARGPVGLEGLTTRKFIVLGEGQIRQ